VRIAVKIIVTAAVYLGVLWAARATVVTEAVGFLRGVMWKKK
jgi:hypothetical protein